MEVAVESVSVRAAAAGGGEKRTVRARGKKSTSTEVLEGVCYRIVRILYETEFC